MTIAGAATAQTIERTSWLRARLEAALTRMLEREVTIGAVSVGPGVTATIVVEDVAIANPDWASRDHFVTLDRAAARLDLTALLRDGALSFESLSITEPVVALERSGEEQATWRRGLAGEDGGDGGDAPADVRAPGFEFPSIARFEIEGGRVIVDDQPTRTDVTVEIASLVGALPVAAPTRVELDGSIDETPFAATLEAGPVRRLRPPSDEPLPLTLTARLGENALRLDGRITQPDGDRDVRLAARIDGPSLAALPRGLGPPLPDTPPYMLDGRLVQRGDRWALEAFEGTLGETRVGGTLAFEGAGLRPEITGEVHFPLLRMRDLGGLVGAGPGDPDPPGLFPRERFEPDRLYRFDADLELSAEEIQARLPVRAIDTRLVIVRGRAVLDPLRVAVADGTLRGELAVNGREEVPSADLAVDVDGLSLKPFFRETRFVQEMGGRVAGEVSLLGVGRSLDALFSSARGRGYLTIEDGSLSGLMVEGVGLDLVEALAMVADDARVAMPCARLDLAAEAGVVTIERALADTADSLLVADGTVDLGAERLDLRIEGRARDFSLIDASAPVLVTGPIADPEITMGDVEGLPFFQAGDQPAVSCEALLSGRLEVPPPGADAAE
ncbi:MAG: AsmA family protein [Alphaproteobacteria bacterium]